MNTARLEAEPVTVHNPSVGALDLKPVCRLHGLFLFSEEDKSEFSEDIRYFRTQIDAFETYHGEVKEIHIEGSGKISSTAAG